HDQDDHDMEHCSEQDDVREREHEEEEEDDDDDDDGRPVSKQARIEKPTDSQPAVPSPLRTKTRPAHARGDDEEDDDDNEEGHSTFASSSSSRKPSIGGSPLREDTKPAGKGRAKATPRKKAPRLPSVQAALDEAFAEMDDDNHGQEGAGSQSLHGKGLGYYAPLVCDHVEARGVTTYNDVVNDLAGIPAGTPQAEGPNSQEPAGQGNIRRRVYDALNILQALDIISMDKKDICWIGLQDAKVIREASRRVNGANLPARSMTQQERDGADESEEPEDDDMEIEQLQKEVEAMRLKVALETAQLQDQVARHVQLNNLIKRNKLHESKELERLERRRLKKQEREEKRGHGDGLSKDLVDEHKKRSERRHHRHSTPRPDKQGEGGEEGPAAVQMVGDETEEDIDEETARRIRKLERQERREKRHGHHSSRQGTPRVDLGEAGNQDQEDVVLDQGEAGPPEDEEARRLRKQERRERRERKEKRAHKRQEKEAAIERANAEEGQRIQLPFVIVRIPGYAGQSSDSEANISVVRRMREDQRPRKSGKSKKHCVATGNETTMVEVKIPHQDELSIISDTEILSDLGMNTVSLSELKEMLPEDMIPSGCFATATATGGDTSSHEMTDSGVDVRVTVSNGYERAIVCS
ncbi:transcription factor Dp, member 3, partial [Mortierella sp. 14UC]